MTGHCLESSFFCRIRRGYFFCTVWNQHARSALVIVGGRRLERRTTKSWLPTEARNRRCSRHSWVHSPVVSVCRGSCALRSGTFTPPCTGRLTMAEARDGQRTGGNSLAWSMPPVAGNPLLAV